LLRKNLVEYNGGIIISFSSIVNTHREKIIEKKMGGEVGTTGDVEWVYVMDVSNLNSTICISLYTKNESDFRRSASLSIFHDMFY